MKVENFLLRYSSCCSFILPFICLFPLSFTFFFFLLLAENSIKKIAFFHSSDFSLSPQQLLMNPWNSCESLDLMFSSSFIFNVNFVVTDRHHLSLLSFLYLCYSISGVVQYRRTSWDSHQAFSARCWAALADEKQFSTNQKWRFRRPKSVAKADIGRQQHHDHQAICISWTAETQRFIDTKYAFNDCRTVCLRWASEHINHQSSA